GGVEPKRKGGIFANASRLRTGDDLDQRRNVDRSEVIAEAVGKQLEGAGAMAGVVLVESVREDGQAELGLAAAKTRVGGRRRERPVAVATSLVDGVHEAQLVDRRPALE